MRTLYLNGRFLTQRTTGVQRHAGCLLQALDARLAAGAAPGLRAELLLPVGTTAPRLRSVQVRPVPGGHGHAWEQWALPRAARDGLLLNLAGAAPAFARAQVATLHDAALWDRPEAYTAAFRLWYRWLFRRLARRAELLLTVSAFSRQRLAAVLPLAPARLQVVRAGAGQLDAVQADATVLDRLGLRGTRFLLAVGSANPSKNLSRLVSAFAQLRFTHPALADVRLVIVGGGAGVVFAGLAPVRAAADTPGVVRTGAVADAPLKALYQHAQALVFPSLYEGAGLPPLEAMSCGCPVLVARIPALQETCAAAALYVDPLDGDAITTAMAQLLVDAPLRARLSAAGHAHAATRGWDAAALRLLGLLQPLLALPCKAAVGAEGAKAEAGAEGAPAAAGKGTRP